MRCLFYYFLLCCVEIKQLAMCEIQSRTPFERRETLTDRVIIFDLNGTLADDWPQVYQSMCAVFEHYGKTPPKIRDYCNTLVVSGDYKKMYENWGIHVSRDEINSIFQARYAELIDTVEPVEGAEEFLRRFTTLSEHKAYLVTANSASGAIPLLEKFNILKFFQECRFDSINKTEDIEDIVQYSGVAKNRCYYVGDTPSDIRHANAADIRSIAYLNEYILKGNIEAEKPWKSITRLAQLNFLHRRLDC